MRDRTVTALGLAAGGAALAVHAGTLARPYLYFDDWAILTQSWTWAATGRNLWLPMNEHCWPLTRLAAYAVVRAAGEPTAVPLACALSTRLLLLLVMGLTYRFVRRERGDPFAGLVTAALFGVTSVYQEGVYWFAAGPGLAAAATGLLALLAAQRWRDGAGWGWLLVAATWSAVAPAWFAGGLLAAPLVVVYLLAPPPAGWRNRFAALLPLAGPAVFLAVSLPRAGDRILHAEHYNGETAVQAFDPVVGAVTTARSLVDNLLLGAVGVGGVTAPPAGVVTGLLLLAAAWAWWWRRATCRRLVLLGTAMVLANYLAIYSGRAGWPYETALHNWSRYHVAPQLGLALVVAGGLPAAASPTLSRRQARVVAGLILALLVVHLPRGLSGGPGFDPAQPAVLRAVADVDRLCRHHRIAAADAMAALDRLPIPDGADENAWVLLRGSPDPLPHPAAEVRRLLAPATGYPAPPP